MSKDIRSYFTISSQKSKLEKATEDKKTSRKRNVISSDDEDCEVIYSKKAKTVDHSAEKVVREIPVTSVANVLGKKPVKRVAAKKVGKDKNKDKSGKKPTLNISTEAAFDDDFEETIKQLDNESEFLKELDQTFEKDVKKTEKDKNIENSKKVEDKKEKKIDSNLNQNKIKESDKKEGKKGKLTQSKDGSDEVHEILNKSKEKKKKGIDIEKQGQKKHKPEDFENDLIEEKIEKKKQHAMLYQNYLHRGGARNPGSKEIPLGEENCLSGLSFLITGVLDSLEREEAESLIKKYGGRIVSSVSKKLNYLIAGDEAGPSKIAKAQSYNIETISENKLLDLIKTLPGKGGNVDSQKENKTQLNLEEKKKNNEPKTKSENSKKIVNIKMKSETTSEFFKSNENKEESNLKFTENVQTKKESNNKSESGTLESSSLIDNKKSELLQTKVEFNNQSNKSESETLKSNSMIITKKLELKPNVIKTDFSHVSTPPICLVDKYKPTEMKKIIGQSTDKSNAKKLHNWLSKWFKNREIMKNTKSKPSYKDDTGAIYKAALLSGPPGIGKTTTAHVVSKELGFDVIEFNASDTRSKKLLQNEIAGVLSNNNVKNLLSAKKTTNAKHVLIMDEVDGMAGNEDRGGIQELILFIKSTEIPIICICNDRMHPKIRTLSNYTYDLRFQKPRIEQIKAAMMSICCKENIKISSDELGMLIQSTNQDIRQILNHLALLSSGNLADSRKVQGNLKNLKLGPWDVVRKVFSYEEQKNMNIHEKSDLFFHDYNISPLFVQENYLSVTPHGPRNKILKKLSSAADNIATGDLIEKVIRGNSAWSLLPTQACFASVIPGSIMAGYCNGPANFPSWLGRNSKRAKFDRLLQDLTVHTRLTTGASKEAINLDYVTMLVDKVLRPLTFDGTDGVNAAIEAMSKYNLVKEDIESLVELSLWPGKRDPMQSIDSKVKAAFTRAYNKSAPKPFTSVSSKKKQNLDNDELLEQEGEQSNSDEEDEKIENDKMIKAKISTKSKASKSSDEIKPKQKKTTKKASGIKKK